MKQLLYSVLILALISACSKADCEPIPQNDSKPQTKYYNVEIFSMEYTEVYGTWKFVSLTGSIAGGTYPPIYDFLEIKPYGIFNKIKQGKVIQTGKIKVIDQTNDGLHVYFVPENSDTTTTNLTDQYIHFNGNDEMSVNDPCCDRYSSYFERVK